MSVELWGAEPPRDCPLCPRLVAYRQANAAQNPDWWNGPAPSFGDPAARLLVAGLAPGRTGANRTGRPFTGDSAGDLLYGTLLETGLASGTYAGTPDDGLTLNGTLIVNAVRCLPPANKPTTAEIRQCNQHLQNELAAMPRLKVIVALGAIAHQALLQAYGLKLKALTFGHNVRHEMPDGRILIDSYHCSGYNWRTGRLSRESFEAVFAGVRQIIK